MLRVGAPSVRRHGGRVRYEVALAGAPGADSLWFSVPEEFGHMVCDRADAALVALLMVAMRTGQDLQVEGVVTDELSEAIDEVQDVLRRVQPVLTPIRVQAAATAAASGSGDAVLTGYSAGVDSYAVLDRFHFRDDVPEALRITHLLYNNVGSHGHGARGNAVYRERLERIRPGAASLGLPLIDVDSNLDQITLPAKVGFLASVTMRNMAVGHLLSNGARGYHYASSVPYTSVRFVPEAPVTVTDPVLLPLLSTETLTLRSANSDLGRLQKTRRVAATPHAYTRLDVCIDENGAGNCGACWKCVRTMLTLDLIGELGRFDAVFPPPTGAHWRERRIAEEIVKGDTAARELVALYGEQIGIGPGIRLRVGALRARDFSARVQRAVQRRMPGRAA